MPIDTQHCYCDPVSDSRYLCNRYGPYMAHSVSLSLYLPLSYSLSLSLFLSLSLSIYFYLSLYITLYLPLSLHHFLSRSLYLPSSLSASLSLSLSLPLYSFSLLVSRVQPRLKWGGLSEHHLVSMVTVSDALPQPVSRIISLRREECGFSLSMATHRVTTGPGPRLALIWLSSGPVLAQSQGFPEWAREYAMSIHCKKAYMGLFCCHGNVKPCSTKGIKLCRFG